MKRLVLLGVLTLGIAFPPWLAFADFPDRPIKVLVGYTPGGMTDIQARFLAKHVEKQLNQAVIVENRPGGGGTICWNAVSRAVADGYTLGFMSNGTLTAKYTVKDVTFSYKDFEPLANLAMAPVHILAKKNGPYDMPFKKLVSYIKEHPREVRAALAGAYNSLDFTRILVERTAGIELPRVPFKGDPEIAMAVLGGHVALGFGSGIPAYLSLYKDGKINSLAVSSEIRDPFTPEVPTLRELGYDVVHVGFWYVAAPRGIPPARSKILADAIKKAMDSPEMQADFKQVGVPMYYQNPQETMRLCESYDKVYGQLSKELGVEPK
jgi:tripartite-type tricarboxylate transporter receptor subunit TctC